LLDAQLTPGALFYAMCVPGVSTTIHGMDSMAVLDRNLSISRDFQPHGEKQLAELREHGQRFNGAQLAMRQTERENELGIVAQRFFPL
jgi:hypothetical protein